MSGKSGKGDGACLVRDGAALVNGQRESKRRRSRRPREGPRQERPAGQPDAIATWLRREAGGAEAPDRIHIAQQRAKLVVTRELVLLYWQIGRDILARQADQVIKALGRKGNRPAR